MKRSHRYLSFDGPRRLSVATREDAPPGPGEVAVRAIASGVSRGTEMLLYCGELPEDLPLDETLSAVKRRWSYPVSYGYSLVGVIDQVGPGCDRALAGKRVFAFAPHGERATLRAEDVIVLPDAISDDAATLLANMETAVSLVMDAAPLIGERVLVLGLGVVGLLTLDVLGRFPLGRLDAVDPDPARHDLAERMGARVSATLAGEQVGTYDLVLELSGNPAALDTAIEAAGFEGRIVVGSWYGAKPVTADLGRAFHRRRLTLAASQVSRLASELTGRFDKQRRLDVALSQLSRLDASSLISHRVSLMEAPELYAELDRGKGLHAIIHYGASSGRE